MKKLLKYLPIPLALFGVAFALLFRKQNEAAAYIVCAVCTAAAMILLSLTRYDGQIKHAKEEETLLKRIADGETFSVILNVLSPKKLGKAKPDKQIFSLDVYPNGTDEELLKKVSSFTASKQEFARAEALSLGSVYLTEAEARKLKGMTLIMFQPDYLLLGRIFAYRSLLSENKIIFDMDKNAND